MKAFRVTFPAAYSLASGASMSINIPMKAPLTFGPGSIAWASFAHRAFPADGSPALSAEPIKVGIASVPPYSVGDRVWLDENSNGYQDAGESGILNVRVVLYDNTGSQIASTYTDADGRYLFVGLELPDFFVRVDETSLPAGMTQTPTYRLPESDFGNQDQSTGPGDFGYPVKVLTAIPNRTADFGYNHNPAADVLSPVGSPSGTIGDRVWLDLNGNGRQESQEPGVRGVTVQVFTAGPDGIFGTVDDVAGATRSTDDTGRYLFDGLSPGAYIVRVVSDSGASHPILGSNYTQTGDPDDFGKTATTRDHATTLPIVLAPGDVFVNADFGYQPSNSVTLGTIGNLVWFDTDANGASSPSNPSETGLAGVGLSVIRDTNGNGIWDAGEPILATTTTDATGAYQFQGFPLTDAGDGDGTDADYLVWVSDAPGVVALMAQTYDNDGPNDRIGRAILSSGKPQDLTVDFSFKPTAQPTPPDPIMGMIGDRVWFDADRNGVFDSNETPLSTVVMELLDANGDVIGVTVTDPHGRYVFPGLNPNLSYTVRVGAVNFEAGSPLAGMQNTFDPDGGANGSVLVNLGGVTDGPNDPDATKNGTNLGIDFGYGPPSGSSNQGMISNQLWHDANGDGVYTPLGADGANGTEDDEAPLAGVTLELYRDLNLNGQIDPGEPLVGTTTTDNTGRYSFTGLPLVDGTFDDEIFTSDPDAVYLLHVSDSARRLTGYWNTLGDPSLAVDDTSKPDPVAVPLTSGNRTVTQADFGYSVKPGALGNFVWLDTNANGIQDSGEPGIDGIQLQLQITYPDATVTTLRTVTGDNPATLGVEHGWYQFGNLLQDENYRLGTGSGQPTFSISVVTPAGSGLLTGLRTTRFAQGSDTTLDSNDPAGATALPIKGVFTVIQQSSGSSETGVAGYDFGFARVYSLGNRVWLDTDNNGLDDGTEPGADGVAVGLYSATDTLFTAPLASVVTNPEGYYRFDGLYAGDYVIRVEPSNWNPTTGRLAGYNGSSTSHTGPVSGDGSINVIDRDNHAATGPTPAVDGVASGVISLGNGTGLAEPTGETEPSDYGSAATGSPAADAVSNLTVDFGFYRLAVGDWVYSDNNLNGNGRVDPGDPRIGSTVSTGTAVSDAGDLGNYRFTGLPTVGTGDADAPSEFVAVIANPGSVYSGYWGTFGTPNTSSHGQSSPYALELSAGGSTNITADFGFMIDGAAVGNRVWKDTNGDGLQSAGELGIDGVVVQLKITYADGTVTTIKTLTGDDPNTLAVETGWYTFGNIDLDEDLYSTGISGQPSFELSVLTPPDTGPLAGLTPTLVHQGTDGALDADTSEGAAASIHRGRLEVSAQTPPSLESVTGSYDFGFAPAAPTAVTLAYVRGYRTGTRVVIEWQTVWEDRSLGFDVERLASGGWIRVNPEFIPALNEPGGALYHTIDDSGPSDGSPRQYRLVELETSGGTNYYGPFTVTTPTLSQIQSIRLSAEHLEIQFEGERGATYLIETTTDLVKGPWVAMGRRTADGRGRFEWIEPAGQPSAQRFYRAIHQ